MRDRRIEFLVERSLMYGRGQYLMFARSTNRNGIENHLKSLVWEEQSNDHCSYEPPIVFNQEEVQCLFEELWRAGFRPTTNVEGVGELRATKEHLKDLKRLVSKYAEVDLCPDQ